MDDVLYTISEGKIKANSLDDLSEIKTLKIRNFENPVYYGGGEVIDMPMVDAVTAIEPAILE